MPVLINVKRGVCLVATFTCLTASAVFASRQDPAPATPATGAPSAGEMPTLVRKALDGQFKGWQLATIDPQSVSCRTKGDAPPAFVQGDFNSDGHPDVAMAIKTARGVRLVVAISRVGDATLIDVDSLGDATAGAYLGVEPRGGGYTSPDSGLADSFSADTLAVFRCGQPETVYFWFGADFRKATLASSR